MVPKPKRLLVAVDCTKRAMQTIQYAGEEEAFQKMQMVLFNVFNNIPEAYYDLEKEPKSVKVVRHVRSWEINQKKEVRAFMEQAKKTLVEMGFNENNVQIKIQNRRKGVARDILEEAVQGYDAVLIRRRGATALNNIVMGSVSAKLMEKLTFMPVLIAGRNPVNKKILLAVDGSPCATRAVRFIAETIGPLEGYEVCLFHALRGKMLDDLDVFKENGISDSEQIFAEAERILLEGGFSKEAISYRSMTGVLSRAGAIVNAAEEENWGTIVLGRRGLSRVREFFMGRVSSKVVFAGRKNTVWIVT